MTAGPQRRCRRCHISRMADRPDTFALGSLIFVAAFISLSSDCGSVRMLCSRYLKDLSRSPLSNMPARGQLYHTRCMYNQLPFSIIYELALSLAAETSGRGAFEMVLVYVRRRVVYISSPDIHIDLERDPYRARERLPIADSRWRARRAPRGPVTGSDGARLRSFHAITR